ncbi:MAG: hypothetical protein MI923_26760 [Phycisphaerales bacterium]|nr:hypothetical protein [Phycisphaerales bacterium]
MMHVKFNISGFCSTRQRWIAVACLAWALLTVGAQASGQEPDDKQTPDEKKRIVQKVQKTGDTNSESSKPTAKTHPYDPMIWDVDQMMEDAVMQITLRYNLNKSQEEYTRLLLTTRVRSFLDDYEGDIRELLQESIEYRRGMMDSDPESLKQWADRAGPIYEAAQDAILSGNMAWREILDDEQRKTHDRDLKLMERNFSSVTKRLVAWQDGKGKLGPGEPISNGPRQTSGSRVSPNPPGQISAELEDNWTRYVNEFIKVYKLDEKQQNSAREKIHKYYLNEAKRYRAKKKAQFTDLDKKLASKGPKADRTKIVHEKIQLLQPIYKMFGKMAQRLDDLRTSEQKVNVDSDKKKELDRLHKQFSGQGMTRLKASKPKPSVKTDKAGEPPKTEKAGSDSAKKKSPDNKPEKAAQPASPKSGDSTGKPEKETKAAPSPKKDTVKENNGES